MSRINLQVPFVEKDEAKRHGARWDADHKVWYVPDGIDGKAFHKWIPVEPCINIRAARYFIAESAKACWKCGGSTRVYGFLLPAGHETVNDAGSDDDAVTVEWVAIDEPTIIHYVDCLPIAVQSRIATLTHHYRLDFSQTTQSSYWMNHCEHCGMKQGDFEMYCEPQGAFLPLYKYEAEQITVHLVHEPFEASCGGFSYGIEWFEYMRRRA